MSNRAHEIGEAGNNSRWQTATERRNESPVLARATHSRLHRHGRPRGNADDPPAICGREKSTRLLTPELSPEDIAAI